MPGVAPAGAIATAEAPWPQPMHWLYATGKIWQGPVAYDDEDEPYGDLFGDD